MLVLSRKKDEFITIGDDIEITVVEIRGDKVRLGITAPTEYLISRGDQGSAFVDQYQRWRLKLAAETEECIARRAKELGCEATRHEVARRLTRRWWKPQKKEESDDGDGNL